MAEQQRPNGLARTVQEAEAALHRAADLDAAGQPMQAAEQYVVGIRLLKSAIAEGKPARQDSIVARSSRLLESASERFKARPLPAPPAPPDPEAPRAWRDAAATRPRSPQICEEQVQASRTRAPPEATQPHGRARPQQAAAAPAPGPSSWWPGWFGGGSGAAAAGLGKGAAPPPTRAPPAAAAAAASGAAASTRPPAPAPVPAPAAARRPSPAPTPAPLGELKGVDRKLALQASSAPARCPAPLPPRRPRRLPRRRAGAGGRRRGA